MPGNTWTVDCPGCGATSELWDGVGRGRAGSLFGFVQYGCASCGRLESLRVEAAPPAPGPCPTCAGTLAPWAGVVGHKGERPSEAHAAVNRLLADHGREPIKELVCHGPCPRCQTALVTQPASLWD